jgi:predicted O-methyltransferase YrrM
MSQKHPVYRLLTRWHASLSKRLFWPRHLEHAIATIKRFIREMPTPETMATIPLLYSGRGHYRTLDLKQNMAELLGLIAALRKQPLLRVCEIGTFKGGTLFIWCQLAEPDAKVISIDLPGGAFGGGYTERSVPFFESFCRAGQQLTCLRQSSHDPATRAELEKILAGEQLDFLFIDGDHTYEGVKKDYDLYAPLVRSGGMIGFHDIVDRPAQPDIQVHRFWHELKQGRRHKEFIETSPDRRQIGIGLLYVD